MSKLAELIRLPKGVNNCVRVAAKVRQLGRNNGIRVQTIQPCTTRRTAEYLKFYKMIHFMSIVKHCKHLHGLNLPGGDLIWVPQPPACFLVEASGVDGSLKSTLKLRECAIAGSIPGQVFAPGSTINIKVIKGPT